jgi:hypothetical protein
MKFVGAQRTPLSGLLCMYAIHLHHVVAVCHPPPSLFHCTYKPASTQIVHVTIHALASAQADMAFYYLHSVIQLLKQAWHCW